MQDSEDVLCSSSDDDTSSTSSTETLDSDDDDDNRRLYSPEKQKTHTRQPSFYPQMPVSNPNSGNQTGQGQRTTFRPPWVKEGPTPLPMPSAPWTKSREANSQSENTDSRNGESSAQPRKQSKITIIPSNPADKENGKVAQAPVCQQSKEVRVPRKTEKVVPISIETKSVKKEPEIPIAPPIPPPVARKEATMNNNAPPPPMPPPPPPMPPSVNRKPPAAETEDESESSESSDSDSESTETESISETETDCTTDVEIQEINDDDDETGTTWISGEEIIAFPDEMEPTYVKGEIIIPQQETGRRQYEYNSNHSSKKEKTPVSKEKAAKLESLRARPRRRPDWTDMMKEVEQGTKLKHVQCNDRSAPILPEAKAKGQYVYESEKDNAHNILLKQIQQGVRLKKTRTNDRSRPVLDGLRKFRRQMTIEEQIQKSTSVADVVALAAEPDELDDIDKVRDDLQSAKQMLALELRNKEGLERENKRLMARLLNLEVELEKEKASKHIESEKGGAVGLVQVKTDDDEKLVQKLKEEASEAAAVAKEMEDKYQKIAEELDTTRAKLESAWLRNQQIELQLKAYEKGSPVTQITKQPSSKKLAASMASVPNGRPSLVPSEQESEYEEETEESESEEETDDKDSEAAQERRQQREMKLLTTKVKSFKSKMNNALKERHKLKDMLKKQQKMVREEKKKYKLLQKEVDKMAKLMKDVEEDDLEEEEDEKDVEEEETETESESESEESEEEIDDSDEECFDEESATPEQRKKTLSEKAKRYENRLSSLKKGNYLLKANIDRLQDDLNRQKEMSLALQEDLNSVLAELG